MEPWLRKRTRLTPAAPALIHGGRTYSFADLDSASEALARALLTQSIRSGDRVALLAAPSPSYVHLMHALQYIGATLVPINTRATPLEVRDLLATVRPKAILHDNSATPLLTALPPPLKASCLLVAPDRAATLVAAGRGDPPQGGADRPPGPGHRLVGDLHAPRPYATASCAADLSPMSIHSMLFTSGTTGRPKAACLTHANHEASAHASAEHLAIDAHERWLLCMPLCHVGGLAVVLRSAITGFAVVLHETFDADAVNRAITEGGVTVVSVVPTMLVRMLDALGARSYPETLRVVLTGGAPLPPALYARACAAGVPIVPTYGLTEAASQVATGRPGAEGSVGVVSATAVPGAELRIEEPDASGVGEIVVHGPMVMPGYFEDATASRAALRAGWLHTGDAGRISNDGVLTVVGRRSDLIVSGGENVYPAEVERILLQHPDVDDVAVYGVPDDVWGERVAAAVVPAGDRFDADSLRTWSVGQLAGYKIPRLIRLVTILPRTASGKLRRVELRAAVGVAAR